MRMESKWPAGTWTPVTRCPLDTSCQARQGASTPLTPLPSPPTGRQFTLHNRTPAADTILMVSVLRTVTSCVHTTCSWKFGTCPGGRPRYQSKRCLIFSGSLPPSPADSGVSDVDPSSSSHNSDDENRLHRHRHAMQGRLKACTVSKSVTF